VLEKLTCLSFSLNNKQVSNEYLSSDEKLSDDIVQIIMKTLDWTSSHFQTYARKDLRKFEIEKWFSKRPRSDLTLFFHWWRVWMRRKFFVPFCHPRQKSTFPCWFFLYTNPDGWTQRWIIIKKKHLAIFLDTRRISRVCCLMTKYLKIYL
jgi:hypothetical protein